MERVRDLITQYENEGRHKNPNIAAFEEFVQKIKAVLDTETEKMTQNDGANVAESDSNRNVNINVSASSSSESSSEPIDAGISNSEAKDIKAFPDHVILRELFKCGSFRDLKNFRLVNKQWKGIANSAIIQRKLWKLKLKDIIYGGRDRNIIMPLMQLNNCIIASGGSFPLTTLDFSDLEKRWNWNRAALFDFYQLMGESITHVIFNNSGPLTVNEFQDLLMNKMPNVDSIDAGKIIFTNKGERPISLDLPKLKTIRFIDYNGDEEDGPFEVEPYYKDLLRGARNLKKIQDFHIQLTNIVIETGKIGCIQKLNFALELLKTCSPLYFKLSHSKLKLTSLTITAGPEFISNHFKLLPTLAKSLKRILSSSKKSLRHLQCLSNVFPVDFVLPKFSNLEYLTVNDSENIGNIGSSCADLEIIFPRGCDCSEIFPKVHTVILRVWTPLTIVSEYFPGQAMPSVQTLAFQGIYQHKRSFKHVFPNAAHIKIIDYQDIVDDARKYCECFLSNGFLSDLWNQIESLELHQCQLVCPGQEFQLDSLFTGVSTQRCGKLLRMYNERKGRGEVENIMFAKGIVKALQSQHGACVYHYSAGLRRIKIVFNHPENADFLISQTPDLQGRYSSSWPSSWCENGCGPLDDSSDDEVVESMTPVMTLVSCVYGFSLMPNLEQVIIGYDYTLDNASDIAQVLKPFAEFPCVKIVHELTDWNDYRD